MGEEFNTNRDVLQAVEMERMQFKDRWATAQCGAGLQPAFQLQEGRLQTCPTFLPKKLNHGMGFDGAKPSGGRRSVAAVGLLLCGLGE